MALGAVVGAALGLQTTPRPWALYVDSLDVLRETGTSTPRWAVPIERVRLRFVMWDQVGSLTFEIDDPQVLLSNAVGLGGEVSLREYRAGVTHHWFFGYVTNVEYDTDFGEQGQRIKVTASSADILLDWTVTVADLTYPIGATMSDIFMGCFANSLGHPELRILGDDSETSTKDLPTGGYAGAVRLTSVTIPAGTTIRSAAQMAVAGLVGPVRLAVDPYKGVRLRIIANTIPPTLPAYPLFTSAYNETGGTINVPGAGSGKRPENVERLTDGNSMLRAIAAKYTGLTTVFVTDGSGVPGPTAVVDFSNDYPNLTQAGLSDVAVDYLASHGESVRGQLVFDDGRTNWAARPMSLTVGNMSLTLAALGVTSEVETMSAVDVTFHGDDWRMEIAFGAVSLSFSQRVRNLTRDFN